MLDTALAQLRFAASVAFGIPFSLRSLDRLVAGLCETQQEFGSIGSEAAEALGGPALDEPTRRTMQLRRFRAQARRAAGETTNYQDLFARLGLEPAALGWEEIQHLPPTTKGALRADPDAFVRRTARPVLWSTTTGTTGHPTGVAFSAYELRVMAALATIAFLYQHLIAPEDIVQISTSARALGNLGVLASCTTIGALAQLVGVADPEQALARLAHEHHLAGKKPRVSVLSTYPSYLGELVESARRLGYRPADFGLERIFLGGEIVTDGLREQAQECFGSVTLVETYATTETLPFGGTPCNEGHLHFEPSHGLLEVLDPETGGPARAGEAGTLVATPFRPYRETTILLRYDTEDVARPLAEPLTCQLRHLPATTQVLGKLRASVRHEAGWTYPREVLEALEAVEAVPLPARCGLYAVPGGVAVEVVARAQTPEVRREIATQLEARGVPMRELHILEDRSQLEHPLPLRCDLRELSFGSPLADRVARTSRPRSVDAAVQDG